MHNRQLPILVLALVLAPMSGFAKSERVTLQDLIAKSDAIVTGTAMETKSVERNEIIGVEILQCQFQAKEWIRGDTTDTTVTVEYHVNFDADSSKLPCPKIEQGETYFLFLKLKDSLLTPAAGSISVQKVEEAIDVLDGDIAIKYAEHELVERIHEIVQQIQDKKLNLPADPSRAK